MADNREVLTKVNSLRTDGEWFVGIVHRVKQRKDQVARPTLVAMVNTKSNDVVKFELITEQEELDFLNGACPTHWRNCVPEQDVSLFIEHQVLFRPAKDEDAAITRHKSQCRYEIKKGISVLTEVAVKVPYSWIGIQKGDTVVMMLGGSGDYFASALSRKLDEIGGKVIRIPPFALKKHRGDGVKDDDPALLAHLACDYPEDFYPMVAHDRETIQLRNAYRYWMDTMKARIACEQRIRQRDIGRIFCTEKGGFPEGSIIKEFDSRKANDATLQALLAAEGEAEKELKRIVESLNVWAGIFENIEGIGYRIAARIINSVIDIRRFETPAQFAKFLGVHVLADGRFPRRRHGELAGWNPDGRQALYLFADQLIRQKDRTHWGRYFLARKKALRVKHPEAELGENKKKRYTDGHIHKMAIWRTLTRFAEYLHREWWKVEKSATKSGSEGDRKVA